VYVLIWDDKKILQAISSRKKIEISSQGLGKEANLPRMSETT